MRREGFTLIEVMVAVMIVSVVIASLLQLNANNTNFFSMLKMQKDNDQYLTLFIDNKKYGFENEDKIPLYRLLEDFDLDDDLRRELKAKEVNIKYQVVQTIDLAEFDQTQEDTQTQDNQEQNVSNSSLVFEVGKTIMQTQKSSVALLRVRLLQ